MKAFKDQLLEKAKNEWIGKAIEYLDDLNFPDKNKKEILDFINDNYR